MLDIEVIYKMYYSFTKIMENPNQLQSFNVEYSFMHYLNILKYYYMCMYSQ